MKLPGPHGGIEEWNAFFERLKVLVHSDLDMLDAVDASYDDVSFEWADSPWTNGGCGLFAHGVVAWMDDPRATWQVVGKKYPAVGRYWKLGHDPDAPDEPGQADWDFPHAVVVYRSAALGRIYFDATQISRQEWTFTANYGATGIYSRTKRSNADMAENYGCYPWDERRVELIRQTLLAHFGRWPRR